MATNWNAAAYMAICRVAKAKQNFTADDVWKEIKTDLEPADPRSLGPLMLNAWNNKVCEPVNDFKQTNMRQAHGRYKRVWRSLVFRDAWRKF